MIDAGSTFGLFVGGDGSGTGTSWVNLSKQGLPGLRPGCPKKSVLGAPDMTDTSPSSLVLLLAAIPFSKNTLVF